ncbi:uncharacterized protein LOC34620865 [Cyclospora cayetanensis]|uniref:Uncharacterized protein LOC34620865 n=1 Tax=Cyclospora cayetanensis TaxID=88456 RepID=A0A6P6RYI8_9EIME|nr:uncharacterized protein LOC34620865 [Cyclospora cayetanensis]
MVPGKRSVRASDGGDTSSSLPAKKLIGESDTSEQRLPRMILGYPKEGLFPRKLATRAARLVPACAACAAAQVQERLTDDFCFISERKEVLLLPTFCAPGTALLEFSAQAGPCRFCRFLLCFDAFPLLCISKAKHFECSSTSARSSTRLSLGRILHPPPFTGTDIYEPMLFRSHGTGPPPSAPFPKARFCLRVGDKGPLLRLFAHALSRHPFNQQVFVVASDGSKDPPNKAASSALEEIISIVAKNNCSLCLRSVRLDAFLHLPLQQLLLKQLQGSALSWRGPGGSAPCAGGATVPPSGLSLADKPHSVCPVMGDSGGDGNSVALQNDGVMILKLDRFTAQVLELDTWMRPPHFTRKALPPGARYLKVDVQQPAVLRHQRPPRQRTLSRESQQLPWTISSRTPCCLPPSRLYEQLQRSLGSLQPLDLLIAAAPPQSEAGNLEARRKIAQQVQTLLREGGSLNATCHLVHLQCRLSAYRGGVTTMTQEAAEAAAEAAATAAAAAAETAGREEEFLLTPDLPVSHMPRRLLLPDWGELFAAAAAAATSKPPAPHQSEEGVAKIVVRKRMHRRAECRARSLRASQRAAKADSASVSSRRSSSSESGGSLGASRQMPPLRSDYLRALQLLHERQRQGRARKMQQRDKATPAALEHEDLTEEALQLAAPPPFRELPPAEALVSAVSEYLGCVAMDLPASVEECAWLREANRLTDPQEIHVASICGGLLHSTAVMSAAEPLCTWLLSQRPGAWVAISVVGAAETPAAYIGQPHGSDISGESTLHLLLVAEEAAEIRGMFLQTIAGSDATTTLP